MSKPKLYAPWIILLLMGTCVTNLRAQSAWGIQAGETTFFGGVKYALILAAQPQPSPPFQLIGISHPTNIVGTWAAMSQPQGPHEAPPYYTSVGFFYTNYGQQYLTFSGSENFSGVFSANPRTEFDYTPPFGTNWYATGPAPASLTNHSYFLSIMDGANPFASKGSVIFSPMSESNYVVFPTSQGIVETHGTYSYALTNTAAGCFTLTDSVTGSSTEYFGFFNSSNGFFMVTHPPGYEVGTFTVSNLVPAMFFMGQVDLSTNVDWLQFSNGTPFGYYDVMDFGFPCFYHIDLGFEWFFDASNSAHGCYLYDFSSQTFFYTDPNVFPYLYDFTLKSWLYYFPDSTSPGRYTSHPRYFYNFATKTIITK